MITLFKNGAPYTHFISSSARVSYQDLANSFQFVASANKDFPAPVKGDLIELYVDGFKKITGFIENITGSEREGSHTVSYSGRDKTGDFIDSDIDIIDDLNPSNTLTLKRILEILIAHLGIENLLVIDKVSPEPFTSAEDIAAFQPGDSVLEIAREFARKRQCLLTSNEDGNIVISQSSATDSGQTLQNIFGANDNNVFDQEWEITSLDSFNKYIHRGQISPSALNFSGDSESTSGDNQNGETIDPDIRKGRQKVTVESKSFSSSQLKNRAKWTSQLAKARATTYTCTSKGHFKFAKKEPWLINELVQINSSAADISRKMLIQDLVFSEGEGQPTITTFVIVEKDVFTIDQKLLDIPKTGSMNDAFKDLK